MRKTKENLLNTIFLVYNTICIKLFNRKNGNFKMPTNYNIEFVDDFKILNEDVWFKRQYYGHINTSHYWQYCSEDNIDFTEEGLKLHQHYNPRTTDYWDGKTYNTIYDVGFLTSKKLFGYGIFEFDIILPKGTGLWPAVWLTGFESWPPEIDLIEAYSDNDSKYNDDVKTNAFYGTQENLHDIKGRKTIPIKNYDDVLNMKLVWTKDKIEYYYNDFRVRTITDKKILKWYLDKKMYLVLNLATRNPKDFEINKSQKSTFIVKKFVYYKEIING